MSVYWNKNNKVEIEPQNGSEITTKVQILATGLLITTKKHSLIFVDFSKIIGFRIIGKGLYVLPTYTKRFVDEDRVCDITKDEYKLLEKKFKAYHLLLDSFRTEIQTENDLQ